MSRKKTVVIEKDGVRAEATQQTFKGLVKRGWTVVDDENKDPQAADKQADPQQQEQALFSANPEE